jgi:hypothetical protein
MLLGLNNNTSGDNQYAYNDYEMNFYPILYIATIGTYLMLSFFYVFNYIRYYQLAYKILTFKMLGIYLIMKMLGTLMDLATFYSIINDFAFINIAIAGINI